MQTLNDVVETMLLLTRSTAKYVHRRIQEDRERAAYRAGMKLCIEVLSEGLQNLDMIKKRLEGLKDGSSYPYVFHWLTWRREVKYFNMAVDQTLDIVINLETRFITGGSDSEPRGYRAIMIYEEDDTFK